MSPMFYTTMSMCTDGDYDENRKRWAKNTENISWNNITFVQENMCTEYHTIINDIPVYSLCILFSWSFLKKMQK